MTSLTRLLSFVGALFAISCSKTPAPEKTEAAASASASIFPCSIYGNIRSSQLDSRVGLRDSIPAGSAFF